MPRKIVKLFSSLAISGLLALAPAAPAVAQQVAFTVTGAITNAAQGYAVGQPISMTFVLDAAAARLALATPVSICCSGTLSWQQNLLTGEPQLWSSVRGTGLSGAWLPPTDADTGNLAVAVSSAAPATNSFQITANTQLGFPSGLFANGLPVAGLQVTAVFLGLDAIGSFGQSNVISPIAPDPTAMFLSMVGTYASDTLFSRVGTISTNGDQTRFRVDQLTIAAVVPEPGSGLLLAVGCGALGWLVRRRRVAQA